jgi:hypothetical protein
MNIKEYKRLVEIWKAFEEDSMAEVEYDAEEMVTNFSARVCRECGDSADISYGWIENGDNFFAFYCKQCADDLNIKYKTTEEQLKDLEKEIKENRLNSKLRRSCFDARVCYCAPFEDRENSFEVKAKRVDESYAELCEYRESLDKSLKLLMGEEDDEDEESREEILRRDEGPIINW